nr:MAG TPA: hypothetical protein [Caudoviricetes sp.]
MDDITSVFLFPYIANDSVVHCFISSTTISKIAVSRISSIRIKSCGCVKFAKY